MPIKDYNKLAKLAEANLLARKDISDTNKQHVKKFLTSYDVKPATKAKFCKHIGFLLSAVIELPAGKGIKTKPLNDIKSILHDRDAVNKIFSNLRDKLSASYCESIKSVSLRFVRWLNDDDEKPKGFRDIKSNKKVQRRDLKPSDMVTWEEGIKLAETTPDIQMKAIIMTQLEGGFRPSEFIDLNYGDVKREGQFIIVHVTEHKTNPRQVILLKAMPYLLKWIEQHPEKKRDTPLWFYNGKRLKYETITTKVKKLGKQIGLNKPLDFYALRHSACTLAKKDNINPELAAKRFGHSVPHFINTYGRLTVQDDLKRFSKHYGLTETKAAEKPAVPKKCIFCKSINQAQQTHCSQCNQPLSMLQAELDKQRQYKTEELAEKLNNRFNKFENNMLILMKMIASGKTVITEDTRNNLKLFLKTLEGGQIK